MPIDNQQLPGKVTSFLQRIGIRYTFLKIASDFQKMVVLSTSILKNQKCCPSHRILFKGTTLTEGVGETKISIHSTTQQISGEFIDRAASYSRDL